MSDYVQAINQHYGHAELGTKILAALREAGKDIAALSRVLGEGSRGSEGRGWQ